MAAALIAIVATTEVLGASSHRSAGHVALAPSPTSPRVSTTVTTVTTVTPTTTAPSPSYPVEDETITFVDPTRATPARGDVAGHAGRTLVTDILRPEGLDGPLPLVVFAHGWDSDPNVYSALLNDWAAAGYLVAAPFLPDSTDTLAGSPVSNYPAQAQDLSFIITQLLNGRAGSVDRQRIAVAGHSDGGTDIALLALNPEYADHRIRAYLSLSGEIPAGVAGPWGVPTPGALLVVVGSADQYGLAPRSAQIFGVAQMTKAMITVSGGDHLGTYLASTPPAAALRTETIRFLQVALSPRLATSYRLSTALELADNPAFTISVASE